MSKSSRFQSILLSTKTLYTYYAIGIFSFVIRFPTSIAYDPNITGTPKPPLVLSLVILIALAGSIASLLVTPKDNVFFYKHCLWIFNSFWQSLCIGLAAVLINIIASFFNQDEQNVFSIDSLTVMLNEAKPFVLLWFIYKMLYGAYLLLNARAPK